MGGYKTVGGGGQVKFYPHKKGVGLKLLKGGGGARCFQYLKKRGGGIHILPCYGGGAESFRPRFLLPPPPPPHTHTLHVINDRSPSGKVQLLVTSPIVNIYGNVTPHGFPIYTCHTVLQTLCQIMTGIAYPAPKIRSRADC